MRFKLNHLETLCYLNMEDIFCYKRICIQTARYAAEIFEPLEFKDI